MIQISKRKISDAFSLGSDYFLTFLTDEYLKLVDGDLNAQNMSKLSGYQHALIAFSFLKKEINEGGFVQLIQNGYGGYIFDNPTAKALKQMGALQISKIIYKAKEIFDLNRETLEKETTDEEFHSMYVDFEIFDDIEEKYMDIEEKETSIIAKYVKDNISEFADIID